MRCALTTSVASRYTVSVCPAAVPATAAWAENASRNPPPHPMRASSVTIEPSRRMPSPLAIDIRQRRRETPHQPGPDRLATQTAESQGKRRRAPNLGFELHGVERGGQPGETRVRVPREGEPRLVALHQHRLQPQSGAERAKLGDEKQPLRVLRQRAEPIAQLLANGFNLARGPGPRQPPI